MILIESFLPLVQDFTKPGEQEAVRCDTRTELLQRGCQQKDIISPVNVMNTTKDNPLSALFDQQEPVQMRPQMMRLNLRPG